MTHLVIGGCGFLGANVVRGLVQAGLRPRVLDTRSTAVLAHALDGAELRVGDFTRETDLVAALHGVEVVHHMAAPFFIPESLSQPAKDVEVNLVGGVRLLTACVRAGVRRVVFPSSGGAVYGPRPPQGAWRESDRPQPAVSYGIVKLALEGYLAMFQATYGLEYAALRVSNPYGPGQVPGRGQGVIATLLGCAKTGAAFQLFAPRSTVRDYVYMEDVAAAFVAAGQAPGPLATVLNIGSGVGRDLNAVIAAVEQAAGKKVTVCEGPVRGFDAPANVLDCSAAAQQLSWRATTDLAAGLQKTWAWIQAQS